MKGGYLLEPTQWLYLNEDHPITHDLSKYLEPTQWLYLNLQYLRQFMNDLVSRTDTMVVFKFKVTRRLFFPCITQTDTRVVFKFILQIVTHTKVNLEPTQGLYLNRGQYFNS